MQSEVITSNNRDRDFALAPCRFLISAVFLMAGLVLMALWILHANLWLRLLLAMIFLAVSYVVLRDIAKLSGSAVVALRSLYAERSWLLTTRNGLRFKAMQCDARVYRYLVMLTVKDAKNNRTKTLLVTSKALSEDQHRQLRSIVLAIQHQVITDG